MKRILATHPDQLLGFIAKNVLLRRHLTIWALCVTCGGYGTCLRQRCCLHAANMPSIYCLVAAYMWQGCHFACCIHAACVRNKCFMHAVKGRILAADVQTMRQDINCTNSRQSATQISHVSGMNAAYRRQAHHACAAHIWLRCSINMRRRCRILQHRQMLHVCRKHAIKKRYICIYDWGTNLVHTSKSKSPRE